MEIETYCCPRFEECEIAKENELERQYRCHDRNLASICVGQKDKYDKDDLGGTD